MWKYLNYATGGNIKRDNQFEKQSISYRLTVQPSNSTQRCIPKKNKTYVYTKTCT